MKTKIFLILGWTILIFNQNALADCGSGDCWSGNYPDNYSDQSFCSSCQCTDYGYRFNDCISKSEYCEAFGNVGGR